MRSKTAAKGYAHYRARCKPFSALAEHPDNFSVQNAATGQLHITQVNEWLTQRVIRQPR
jgi:hypothetical protein